MKNILIVGGGFAGLWAALGAAQQINEHGENIRITVVSKDLYLNVRPRLYEKNPEALRIPLANTLGQLNVRLIEGEVKSVDTSKQAAKITLKDSRTMNCHYDRLILATGSKLKNLPVPGLAEHGWNIDTYDAANLLDQHLETIMRNPKTTGHNTFVIIGAGFTGIELVTEMRDRIMAHSDALTAKNAEIILIENADQIGPDLGSNVRPVVESALRESNIEVKLGTRVETVTLDSVALSNGEVIKTKTVITTAGLTANNIEETLAVKYDEQGRIITNKNLRIQGIPEIFAAGDVAHAYVDDEHVALMSCQHAMEMGKYAGFNATRDLLGLPLVPYQQPVYLTCLDLGQSGALFTSGWDRQIQKSGDEAKALKQQINTQWIYPPTGSQEQILATIKFPLNETQDSLKTENV